MLKDLYFQTAPSSVLMERLKEEIPDWPHYSSQIRLLELLDPANAMFLVHDTADTNQIHPPITYRKHLNQLLEKEMTKQLVILQQTASEEEAENLVIADEFMENYMKTVNEAGMSNDGENCGYVSYTTPLITPSRIPIYIKRSHNQVGTKVWSAGLYLIELIHSMNHQTPHMDWSGKRIVELGAGVGVTGIVAGLGIIAPTLLNSPNQLEHNNIPTSPCEIIMTDFHPDVLSMIDHSIALTDRNTPSTTNPSTAVIQLRSAFLDWNDTTNKTLFETWSPHCLLAADCTYSSDLNTLLVGLFHDYFKTVTPSLLRPTANLSHPSPTATVHEQEGFLPNRLFALGIPFVLIACTIRQPETYAHFVTSLQAAAATITYQDITAQAYQSIQISGELYYNDQRPAVQVLCIYSKRDEGILVAY